ncbi:MAG: hypothetical protein KTR16_03175 [Acidiferrobacterales bacterium]|nr:hypothetical protein [Acidiferrobacterales bacterium]
MTNKTTTILISTLLITTLAACGANKQDSTPQAADSTLPEDITRPPVFVKRGQENTETDPQETISAEEWQKQQENQ